MRTKEGQCIFCALAQYENMQYQEIRDIFHKRYGVTERLKIIRSRLLDLLMEKSSCDMKPAKTQK